MLILFYCDDSSPLATAYHQKPKDRTVFLNLGSMTTHIYVKQRRNVYLYMNKLISLPLETHVLSYLDITYFHPIFVYCKWAWHTIEYIINLKLGMGISVNLLTNRLGVTRKY